MLYHSAWQPVEQKYYAMRRLFIKTSGAASGSAYAWVEQTQDAAGTFSDDPNGISGTTGLVPAYMADGSTTVADGTICEAVVHYGGWLIAWPILSAAATAGDITSINGETGPAITFAVGTSGTDFTVSAAANTVTHNLPDASWTARGAVSKTAQIWKGTKQVGIGSTASGIGAVEGDGVTGGPTGTPSAVSLTIAGYSTFAGIYWSWNSSSLLTAGAFNVGGGMEMLDDPKSAGTSSSRAYLTLGTLFRELGMAMRKYTGISVNLSATFVVPAISGTVTVTVTSTATLSGGMTVQISDGTHLVYGTVTSVDTGTTFTFTTSQITFGNSGDTMASSGTVQEYALHKGASGTDSIGNIFYGGIITSIATGTLGVATGGTGATTLTAHGILLGEGTSAITATAAMTDGQLLIGQSGGDPLPRSTSGDATIDKLGAITIANDAVTYAKIQNISAASKLLGRGDSGSGDTQEITLGTGLSMSGTTLNGSTGYLGDDEWYSGTGTPTGHNDGDWFYATDTGFFWRKISGTWVVLYMMVSVDGATDGYIATYVGGDGKVELLAPSSIGMPGDVILTSAVAISSTSMANVTGMSFSVAANTNYIVDIVLHIASGVHFDFQLTGPASPTGVLMTVDQDGGSPQAVTAFSSPTAFAGAPLGAFVVYIRASIRNGANAGTVQLQAALTSGSSSQNINANSFMSVRKSL